MVLVFFLYLTFPLTTSNENTVFVSIDGSDTVDCGAEETPCLTVESALESTHFSSSEKTLVFEAGDFSDIHFFASNMNLSLLAQTGATVSLTLCQNAIEVTQSELHISDITIRIQQIPSKSGDRVIYINNASFFLTNVSFSPLVETVTPVFFELSYLIDASSKVTRLSILNCTFSFLSFRRRLLYYNGYYASGNNVSIEGTSFNNCSSYGDCLLYFYSPATLSVGNTTQVSFVDTSTVRTPAILIDELSYSSRLTINNCYFENTRPHDNTTADIVLIAPTASSNLIKPTHYPVLNLQNGDVFTIPTAEYGGFVETDVPNRPIAFILFTNQDNVYVDPSGIPYSYCGTPIAPCASLQNLSNTDIFSARRSQSVTVHISPAEYPPPSDYVLYSQIAATVQKDESKTGSVILEADDNYQSGSFRHYHNRSSTYKSLSFHVSVTKDGGSIYPDLFYGQDCRLTFIDVIIQPKPNSDGNLTPVLFGLGMIDTQEGLIVTGGEWKSLRTQSIPLF